MLCPTQVIPLYWSGFSIKICSLQVAISRYQPELHQSAGKYVSISLIIIVSFYEINSILVSFELRKNLRNSKNNSQECGCLLALCTMICKPIDVPKVRLTRREGSYFNT